jgi:AmiR/NasT family two-component response regulator
MIRPLSTPNFVGQRAVILHRPHAVVEAIARQLTQVGMSHECVWPDLPSDLNASSCGVLFYDADMGHDEQFPWAPGLAPVPVIALIGSEAPGRLAWAIGQGADAHLLKPIGSGGVYSALVIARQAFEQRTAMAGELASLRSRLDLRQVVAEATACLMLQDNLSADAAYDRLRRSAMADRVTIEEAAASVVAALGQSHVRRGA